MAGGGAVFNRRIREGLSDKVIFEERLDKMKEVKSQRNRRKDDFGRRNS